MASVRKQSPSVVGAGMREKESQRHNERVQRDMYKY